MAAASAPSSSLAVTRFARILEVLEARQGPVSAADLTVHLNAPRSSVAALLRSLVDQGLLSLERGRGYLPSLRLAQATGWVAAHQLPDAAFLQKIAALAERLGETAVLWRASGRDVEVVHAVQSASPIALRLEKGARYPLRSTAAGLALLALETSQARSRQVARLVSDLPDQEREAETRKVNDAVSLVRRIGYAEVYGAMDAEVGAIVAPLTGAYRRLGLALGIGGPALRIQSKRAMIIRQLKTLAATQ